MNDNVIIQIENLNKVYDTGKIKVNALRNVNLKVYDGELVAIMGPSGSGKTTMMNILGCLDTPTSGKYILDKVDVSNLNDDELAKIRNKKIGFVFQTFNLLSRTTALKNVELPLLYANVPSNERELKAKKALIDVGLGERLYHMPNELSGGQQQRVAIARALVNDPKIILADEPTGNLDSRMSEEILAIFQSLNLKGKTIIIVTHEQDVALHCKRIIFFRDGQIQSDKIVDNPINAKDVLDKMNVKTSE